VEVARPDDEGELGIVIETLLEMAERGVEERGDSVLAYFPDPARPVEDLLEAVRLRLGASVDMDRLELSHRWQVHEDWEEIWKSGFSSRKVTDRVVVAPVWEDRSPGPGEVVITLEPGMAFGTAEHPTTRGSLRLLDRRVEPGHHVGDIGAGSGILSIACALLGADRVLAVEMDPWSCAAARENIRRNKVEDRVELREEFVRPDFLDAEPPLNGIVANIEAGVLEPLLPAFRAGLEDGGWLVLSGILEAESVEITRAARELGFAVDEVDREGGWWTGAFRVPPDAGPGVKVDGS
jgi:ribosomal protein L11 methyltransferase